MTIAGCESQTVWHPNHPNASFMQVDVPNVTYPDPDLVYFPAGQHINAAKSKPVVTSSFSSSLCCQRSGPELYFKPGNSLRECIDKIRPTSKLPAIVHQTHPEISMAPSSLLLSANYLWNTPLLAVAPSEKCSVPARSTFGHLRAGATTNHQTPILL